MWKTGYTNDPLRKYIVSKWPNNNDSNDEEMFQSTSVYFIIGHSRDKE